MNNRQPKAVAISTSPHVRGLQILIAVLLAFTLPVALSHVARAQDAVLPTATPDAAATPVAPAAPQSSDTATIPLATTGSATGTVSSTVPSTVPTAGETAPLTASVESATPAAPASPIVATGVVEAVPGETLRASRVTGELPVQYAVNYLGLYSDVIDQPITLNMTFDPQDSKIAGLVNFIVLTQDGMRRFLAGQDPADLDIAAGGPVPNDPAFNKLTGTFQDSGHGEYTVIVYNESPLPVTFQLEAINGVLLDVAGQVAAQRSDIAPDPTPTPTAIPYGPVVVTGRRLSGTLDGKYQRSYLSISPEMVDGLVKLTMQYEPKDNPNVAGDVNFWVLDQEGINTLVRGGNPADVNVATGFPSPFANLGDLLASFKASGDNEYTAVVYNTSGIPAAYALNADGALLVDRYGQTNEATAALAEVAALAATPTPTPGPTVLDTSAGELESRAIQGVRGSLDTPYAQNYLGLLPATRDGRVTILMDYDPKDEQALQGHINFWVLDTDGLRRVIAGGRPQDYSIASGAPVDFGPDKGKLRGDFNASGRNEYTLIVYNDSEIPAQYALQVAGATIEDSLGQTTPVP